MQNACGAQFNSLLYIDTGKGQREGGGQSAT